MIIQEKNETSRILSYLREHGAIDQKKALSTSEIVDHITEYKRENKPLAFSINIMRHSGPYKGRTTDKELVKQKLATYFETQGWDSWGIPKMETLKSWDSAT